MFIRTCGAPAHFWYGTSWLFPPILRGSTASQGGSATSTPSARKSCGAQGMLTGRLRRRWLLSKSRPRRGRRWVGKAASILFLVVLDWRDISGGAYRTDARRETLAAAGACVGNVTDCVNYFVNHFVDVRRTPVFCYSFDSAIISLNA